MGFFRGQSLNACAVLPTIYPLKFKVFVSKEDNTMQELVNVYNADPYRYIQSMWSLSK